MYYYLHNWGNFVLKSLTLQKGKTIAAGSYILLT